MKGQDPVSKALGYFQWNTSRGVCLNWIPHTHWPLTFDPKINRLSQGHICNLSGVFVWSLMINIDVCKTLMPPFPNICIIGLTLDLWPTDLNINRGHLLIKDYLPTKFGVSGAKRSWVISCTRLRDTDIPTNMCNAICPSFFEGGHNKCIGIAITVRVLLLAQPNFSAKWWNKGSVVF